MQSPERSDEQALATAQEGQIAAQHLEMDCQSVTSETSHVSSAHDQVDNQRDSPMPQPIPIALTLTQPPDSAEREYATLTPLSSAVTMSHVMAPVHYTSYVPMHSVAVSAAEAAPAVVTSQYISQAQPLTHTQAQVSPVQPSPLILTAVPRKPTPIQHVQPTVQKQAPVKANTPLLSTEELTRDQLVLLEKAYRDSPYPSYHQLAAELKIEVFKVKAWFRKRRRNLHTEIGIEMSKEDEQKVFKQFITQHHDSWRGGQPPPGTPQSSHMNTMFRVPTPSSGEEGHESKSGEGKAMEQDGDHSRGSPAQTSAGEASHPDATANQTPHPNDLSQHPKIDSSVLYNPQQQVATSKSTTKSKSLPKSSRQTKSKTSTSTIRSLLKKEVKYEPVVVAPVQAPPVTSPQPQGVQVTAPQPQAEPAAQTMTYMYQNPEIDNLMREREYLGRLLHQQQMEWQETRKKLVDCDRRLAKVTSNVQASTYTTASHQQAVVSEGEQKWPQVPQTYQHVAVPVSTSAQSAHYVAQMERPSSHGSPAVTTEEGQPQQMQAVRLVMSQPPEDTSSSKEGETEAPQLTQLYAAAPIIVQPGTENHHYVWHQDQQHDAGVQYHHGMYQQVPLDGNNNKDQVMQSTVSVENSGSPYYSDYSGSPASSHDTTHENHGNSVGASKRRNRTSFTREQISQLEAYYKANAHPEWGDRELMAETLGLSDQNVRIWFKNRRAKKQKHDETIRFVHVPVTSADEA
ncbi:uncharacterized protein LOC135493416 isoform X2 [Lineus longissimus]|uniref:uncharacterized protein LOC135493416 isoform X2 n=1 Tax=Lineus longissimus TaxID=88925 RepID=UPI00315CF6D0